MLAEIEHAKCVNKGTCLRSPFWWRKVCVYVCVCLYVCVHILFVMLRGAPAANTLHCAAIEGTTRWQYGRLRDTL